MCLLLEFVRVEFLAGYPDRAGRASTGFSVKQKPLSPFRRADRQDRPYLKTEALDL